MFESVLWGVKTIAWFDFWSIEHVLSGISAGDSVKKHHEHKIKKHKTALHPKIHFHLDVVAVLFLAYLWEAIEHYLEVGVAGKAVEQWFYGVEFWGNRLITDPLLVVGGYLIAKHFPVCVWPARILSVTWLFIHIFVFPHSMYLHEIF